MKRIEIYFQSQLTELKKRIPNIFADPFFNDKITQVLLLIIIPVIAIAWVVAILNFKITEFVVPIRYNSFFGVVGLGSWFDLYRIPLFFTAISLLNLILARVVYRRDRLLGYLLLGTNIFLAVIVIILIINFGQLIEGIR